MSECQACGMHIEDPAEFHPYCVCLMMLGACSRGTGERTVLANLEWTVRNHPETKEKNAELARLQAIVDKLPKTADGVAVVPGMELHTPAGGSLVVGVITARGASLIYPSRTFRTDNLFSTCAAAEAAKEGATG